MSENKTTMGMIDSLSQNVQDMVTPQDLLEEVRVIRLETYELQIILGHPTKVVERAPSKEDVKKVLAAHADIIIRHHPDDTEAARALVAEVEPRRYHLAETEKVPKGDPEIFVIDHMPRGGRRLW